MMKKLWIILCMAGFLYGSSHAQGIRVEGFVGTESPVVDVFWLKPFNPGSDFLFLSRNTFTQTEYENQPGQFTTLNIVAYQFKKTGLGLAVAGTASSRAALQARTGVQWLKAIPGKAIVYTILSTKVGKNADLRWLTIAQYTPSLTEKTKGFLRAEWVSSLGFEDQHRFSAGVLRVGLARDKWQFGPGANFLWLGKVFQASSQNYGVFLTHLF